jgi:hypothetical protein
MPTSTDDKLAAMIGELAVGFAEFKVEYATQRAETRSDLREFEARIKGDLREFEARINGDIRELKAQIDGSIQNLDTKFEGEFRSVEKEFKSLEKRVDRGFGFQKWLAGFLIPTTIGLIGTAVSLAFSAGHLDSSVRQLSARMDKLEQALERSSSVSRQPTPSPPILPLVANPSERIFELRPKANMIDQIDSAIAAGNNPQIGQDITLHAGTKLDAGLKPEWLTNGMTGLVLLDGRLTVDGIVTKFSSSADYRDDKSIRNEVHYSINFNIKHSELEKFKNRISSIDPAGNLPFSICFVRP